MKRIMMIVCLFVLAFSFSMAALVGRWNFTVTNGAATKTVDSFSAGVISSAEFHFETDTTCTVRVDVVRGSVTNTVAAKSISGANDAVWLPDGEYRVVLGDVIRLVNPATNACSIWLTISTD